MRTKYFVSQDDMCVWRVKGDEVTFVDTANNPQNGIRTVSVCDKNDFKSNKQLSYQAARKLNKSFVSN